METLVTSDLSQETKTSVTFWNAQSGTKLFTLRGPPAHEKTLTFIRDEGLAIVETGKPFVHFWQCGHSLTSSRRILCPGKPCALTMSPDGNYLIVAINEKINIWQAATGRIVTVVTSAHYRPVSVLKFTDDGSFLISGGQDGSVLAWRFVELISGSSQVPIYSWSDHSLPIWDIHVGAGGSKSTIFSVSMDRTMKIHTLTSGQLLLSVAFASPLTAVVTDKGEVAVYVGTNDGVIYQIKLHSAPRSLEHHVATDASADTVYRKHSSSITALTMSSYGRHLASSDDSGQVHIWDVDCGQCIKSISCKDRVTNMTFWLGDPDIFQSSKKPMIVFPEVPKLVESIEDDNANGQVVTVWNRADQSNDMMTSSVSSLSTKSSSNADTMGLISQISLLQNQLAKAETINQKLQEFCVDHVFNTGKKSKK